MNRPALLAGVLILVAGSASAQDLASFEKRVTVKTLDNGLTLVVCERPEVPVFSFYTHVDVGADREVPGITGLAHMFEHMAFKGTDVIGTTNYGAEKVALEKVERAYLSFDLERRRSPGRDETKVAEQERAWKNALAEANKYVVTNAFGEIVEREGGVGLNAFTSSQETGYFYSLPSNRLELWAYLESERFLKPVMREFYKERDVVHEERRMRTDSQPIGRLIEEFLAAAFTAHPYGQPVIGWPSDLESFSATDAMEFYRRYYVPANMVVTVVGDVRPSEVVPLVERYFGRLPAAPKPEPLRTIEPPQRAERQVILRETAQPYYIEGYHRPDSRDPDDAVYAVISNLMSEGRTSRLYRSLVRDKKIAAGASGFSGLPGNKYPHLFAFFAISTPGHTPQELGDAIGAEVERIKSEDVTDDELKMVKTRVKADLIRRLGNNNGLAFQLGQAQARYGDWRELFRSVDHIGRVTKADMRRIAQKAFVPENRTVGILESTKLAGGPPGQGGK
ncbi:MAG TPA: pitrilysin family protein [Vicinamibacteria bacterium]|nr:pitrilysin family protein [Vicinamibacteria bacterium]